MFNVEIFSTIRKEWVSASAYGFSVLYHDSKETAQAEADAIACKHKAKTRIKKIGR
jgi:hypothetical protein